MSWRRLVSVPWEAVLWDTSGQNGSLHTEPWKILEDQLWTLQGSQPQGQQEVATQPKVMRAAGFKGSTCL